LEVADESVASVEVVAEVAKHVLLLQGAAIPAKNSVTIITISIEMKSD